MNSLLRVHGLLHRHWSKRVKRKKSSSSIIFVFVVSFCFSLFSLSHTSVNQEESFG